MIPDLKRKISEEPEESKIIEKKQKRNEYQCLFAHNNPSCKEAELKWKRPSLPEGFSSERNNVIFQQLDIKYVIEDGLPVIQLFGTSQEGYSVSLFVHNFVPYIYATFPPRSKIRKGLEDEELCSNFRDALNHSLQGKNSSFSTTKKRDAVRSVEIVHKMSIMCYHEETQPYFLIRFFSPKTVPQARTLLEGGGDFEVDGIDRSVYHFPTFESNTAYILRFMIDCKIGGASWIELPAGKYHLVGEDEEEDEERKTNTTIEALIDYKNIIVYPVDSEEWSQNAPVRTLSFDIECAGRPGYFPDPQIDPVIQIANYLSVDGNTDGPLLKNIFTLNSCLDIPGVDVRCFQSERELLRAWYQFVVAVDPDLLTGYNIVTFDIGYLIERAEKLKVKEFPHFGRIRAEKITSKDSKFSSNQTGTRESKEWFISGRVIFDVYQLIQQNHKLSSYTLNNVSAHFLGQQKEDVHHSIITKLFEGTIEDRTRLAVYCCKDAYLPQKLIDELMCLVNYVELARVTGVPLSFLLTRGQSIRVMSQILRKTGEFSIIVPSSKIEVIIDGFQGAKVMEPKIGFYDEPIPTLDFASLYPSIMQAHNLCFTTLLRKGCKIPEHFVKDVDYEITPIGEIFISANRKEGILPMILTSLLTARGNAKRLMGSTKDKMKKMVYNGRQLALKISANSVYGFTGQSRSEIACVEISSSVTAYGREMIMLTKQTVEEHYSIRNGHHCDTEVIYGDTDSVMVRFGLKTVAEAIKYGKEAAAMVTKKFRHPIKLEFEKVYTRYLLMSKKKYAGLLWTKPDKWDKMDAKGIESVRRDNCGLARYTIDTALRKIIIDADIEGAIEFSKKIISDIYQNKIDLSLVIITKAYSRDADAYKNPQAHVNLALKMKERNPATAPVVGDRIPYVIIKGERNSKKFDQAEDPLYVLDNDIPIDSEYYIKQIISPLCRIFKPIIEDPETLFTTGEHTRHIVIPKPKNMGLLGAFIKERENCLGCKCALHITEKILCSYCMENSADIYMKYLGENQTKEMEFQRLWAKCQNCQGSFHREINCSAYVSYYILLLSNMIGMIVRYFTKEQKHIKNYSLHIN